MSFPVINFYGRTRGCSGYSNATKNIAKAFKGMDANVRFSLDSGSGKIKYNSLPKADVDFFIQTPPFPVIRSNSYKIGYFYWEADRLPREWALNINKTLDEIWVPCKLTKKACLKAGFRGKIEVMFTPKDRVVEKSLVYVPAFANKGLSVRKDTYIFYSIFQWNKRKGYDKLLRAYYNEFSSKDNVILVIKTNPIDHNLHGISRIQSDISKIKPSGRNKLLPPVFLITERLSEEDIRGLHDIGHCFVLPHHGEGWGIPIHDAMSSSSLVITTQYGGITEHLNSSNSFLINSKMARVSPMSWTNLYSDSQFWADPDADHLRLLMRRAYDLDYGGDLLKRSKAIADSMSIQAFSELAKKVLESSYRNIFATKEP